MQQFIFEIAYTEPEKSFSVFAEKDGAIFLDSSDLKSPQSQFSFIGFTPMETIISKNGRTEIKNKEFSLIFRNNVLEVVHKRLSMWKEMVTLSPDAPLPFTNGAAGFFAYDMGRGFEALPEIAEDKLQIPDMAIGIYDHVIGFDLKAKKSYLCLICIDKQEAQNKLAVIMAKLDNFRHVVPNSFRPEWERSKTRAEFKNDIAKIISCIHAGEIFQANLSQNFTAALPDYFNPYAHYLNLRKVNPAPFAAYMKMGDVILSSSSPERFLKIENNRIETRPIKGTAPDTQDATSLKNSPKDIAENVMIVDLMRNDLSKICTSESVKVDKLCEIETYSGLHHMVSSVSGKLKPGHGAIEAISACFPGGSITGAPKIRAMEIIEETEPMRRGAYCGSIGYIDFNGGMDLNIAIRTLTYKGDFISLNVGSGIVADSDPDLEYQETLLKARKIFESFETAGAKFPNQVAERA